MPAAVKDKKTLGDRVYEARMKLGLSQGELADRVGVSRTQIVNIEYDKSSTSIATLKQLSSALKVTSDYLLGLKKK